MTAALALRDAAPLVHCLTNPISMNDCANLLLAVGAKPIMAEHPGEVAEITAGADAVLYNLGNISDTRMEAMRVSAAVAARRGIPRTLDLVGVACSELRLRFALELARAFRPQLVKGNRSEIAALCAGQTLARGVDARPADIAADWREAARAARVLSEKLECAVLVSGREDIVAQGRECVAIFGGHALMGDVTGTGCMLGALAAAYTAVDAPFDAAVAAAARMDAAGSLAAESCAGVGSFRAAFFDILYTVPPGELPVRVEKVDALV